MTVVRWRPDPRNHRARVRRVCECRWMAEAELERGNWMSRTVRFFDNWPAAIAWALNPTEN